MINIHPKAIIEDVKKEANTMIRLLSEENKCLEEKKVHDVERLTKEKDVLAKRIDGLLGQIRTWAKTATPEQKQALRAEMEGVNHYLSKMNEVAQRNTILLEVNHTATRTFLDVLRRAVAKPKVATYGKNGQVRETEETATLLTKSV